LINNKNTFIKYREQDIHWAVYNSEIAHFECICDENASKWEYKDDDDESVNKELCIELVAVKKNENIKTEIFSKVVREVFDD